MHPPGGDAAKVRGGRVGDHRQELPTEISAELKAIKPRCIAPLLDVPDALPAKKCSPEPLLNAPLLSMSRILYIEGSG